LEQNPLPYSLFLIPLGYSSSHTVETVSYIKYCKNENLKYLNDLTTFLGGMSGLKKIPAAFRNRDFLLSFDFLRFRSFVSVSVEDFQPLHQPLKPQKHLKPFVWVEDFQPLLEFHHPYCLHLFTLSYL